MHNQAAQDDTIIRDVTSRIAQLENEKKIIDGTIAYLKSKIAPRNINTTPEYPHTHVYVAAAKRIRATNIITGEVIKFASQTNAVKALGIKYPNVISAACRNARRDNIAYGFRWEFDK